MNASIVDDNERDTTNGKPQMTKASERPKKDSANSLPIDYVRIATKERPTDRFLTAQVREETATDEPGRGDLFFLVEIHNPWFPNSHIGQTIINTVVREYRRGDSTSILVNFETALKKTNQVLAQITQNGETDWIGNLSSLILLVAEGHVHIAQTGRARAFLMRAGKISEVTEGLEEEAEHHPLTTYTNITTGKFEVGDRLLLSSSQLPELVSLAELKPLIATGDPLKEASRELVRHLQHRRGRGIHAFVIEAGERAGQPETIYLDQSLNNFSDLIKRFLTRTVQPNLLRAGRQVRRGVQASAQWTQDWLIPRVRIVSRDGGQQLVRFGKDLQTKTQPLLKKSRAQLTEKFTSLKQSIDERATTTVANEPLAGKTVYRVHHYTERKIDRLKINGLTSFFRKTWSSFSQFLARRPSRSKSAVTTSGLFPRLKPFSWPRGWNWRSPSVLLLALAAVVLVILLVSVSKRHKVQVGQTNQVVAASALDEAKAAQQTAQRDFILNLKEEAKTHYLLAITKAKQANENASTQAEAAAIISQSQKILDQLVSATRWEAGDAVGSFTGPVSSMSLLSGQIVGVGNQSSTVMMLSVTQTGTPATSIALPISSAEPMATTNLGSSWLISGANHSLIRFNPTTSQSTQVSVSGELHPIKAMASFGTTLYAVDGETGQIWKYAQDGTGLAAAKPYLKTPDPASLAQTYDLAIDGDVYVLLNTGLVKKYTKGELVADWTIHNLPTPWDKLEKPLFMTIGSTNDRIDILDDASTGHPARIVEFKKDGSFIRQLLLPDDWDVRAWAFDPDSDSGFIVAGTEVFKVEFPQS